MEKELDELIAKYEEGNMTLITLKAELLRLFSVVWRSEQLKDFREWTRENLDEKDIVTQQAVDMYLESL